MVGLCLGHEPQHPHHVKVSPRGQTHRHTHTHKHTRARACTCVRILRLEAKKGEKRRFHTPKRNRMFSLFVLADFAALGLRLVYCSLTISTLRCSYTESVVRVYRTRATEDTNVRHEPNSRWQCWYGARSVSLWSHRNLF